MQPLSAVLPFCIGLIVGGWAFGRGPSRVAFADPPEDTPTPTARITAPAHGQHVSGAVAIAISASERRDVTVTVYNDGALMGSDMDPPYEMSWDTRLEKEGAHTLLARARDADWKEGVSLAVTVIVDNAPPTVTWVAPREGSIVGGRVQLEAQARDAMGLESVKFLVDGIELGAVHTAPYVLPWDSGSVPNGLHSVRAKAIDRAHNEAYSSPVTVRIVNPNRPPVLEPIGAKSVVEGMRLAFTLSARDPDGTRDPLTFRASHLPPWALFDPTTREFAGTPDYQEASGAQPMKIYPGVVFEACDVEPRCDREEITINVLDVNQPPIMQIPGEIAVKEGQFLTLPLAAQDPDGGPLTCNVERLPPWARFDTAACAVTGIPGFGVASQEAPITAYPGVRLEACDAQGLCASNTVIIIVENVNRPPAWEAIGHKTVDEERQLRFTVRANDSEGDALSLSASPLPEGAAFRDHRDGTGTFTWTPRYDQAGAYELLFSASDGPLSDHGLVRIAVRDIALAISGVIRDTGDDPVEGISVHINQGTESIAEVTTNADGVYLAKGLRPGTYTVKPSYDLPQEFSPVARKLEGAGFAPRSQRVILTEHDQTGVDFTAVLP